MLPPPPPPPLLLLLLLQSLCIWAAPMRAWRSQLAPTDGSRGRCSLYAIPPHPASSFPSPSLSLSHLKIFKTLHINICTLHKSHPLFIDCKMLNAAAGLLHTHAERDAAVYSFLLVSQTGSCNCSFQELSFFPPSLWHFFLLFLFLDGGVRGSTFKERDTPLPKKIANGEK